LSIDPKSKTLVFSDGLDTDKFIDISNRFRPPVKRVIGGIGTHLTNDVGVKPLNIVIKLTHVAPTYNSNLHEVVKLSDTPGKHNGSQGAISSVKYQLEIE
jgi:nicotinate phosphoribosyltransferase